MRLDGRTAIVTGGAKGIGLAIVRRLASEGARVMIADIDEAAGSAAVDAVSGDGEVRFTGHRRVRAA
jgi:glucose 1-dehydrogenase